MNKRPNDYEGIKKMGLWKIGLEQSGKDYIEPKKIKNELVRVPCLVVTLLCSKLHASTLSSLFRFP